MFDIFTICTKNYKEAINFTIPSWLKHKSVKHIYIYTDFDYKHPDDRITVIPLIDPTTDWLKVVGYKALILQDFLENYEVDDFAFIDIDCLIHKDISDVFKSSFDIAVTRMNSKVAANSGVWFVKNSEKIKRFALEWQNLQSKYKAKKKGVVKYKSSYSQRSFSDILHKRAAKDLKLKVLPLDGKVYNNQSDSNKGWIEKLKKQKHIVKILHFKGRRFLDKGLVDKVLKAVK